MKMKKLLFALGISLLFVVALSFSVFADVTYNYSLSYNEIDAIVQAASLSVTLSGVDTVIPVDSSFVPSSSFPRYPYKAWAYPSGVSNATIHVSLPFRNIDIQSVSITMGYCLASRSGTPAFRCYLFGNSLFGRQDYTDYTPIPFTQSTLPVSERVYIPLTYTYSDPSGFDISRIYAYCGPFVSADSHFQFCVEDITLTYTSSDPDEANEWLKLIYQRLLGIEEAIKRNDLSGYLDSPQEWLDQLEAEREAAESSADRLESLIEDARVTLPEYEAPDLGDLELYNTALIAGSFDVIFDSMDFLLPLLLVTIGLCIGSYLLYGKKGD